MAWSKIKTEHTGPKHGARGGAWCPKAEAKEASKKIRRSEERALTAVRAILGDELFERAVW